MNITPRFFGSVLSLAFVFHPDAYADSTMQHSASPHGSGLIVSAESSANVLSNGAQASFRILNASPAHSLSGLSIHVDRTQGFVVLQNSCKKDLAPHSSCSFKISWHGLRSDLIQSQLRVSSSAPALSVSYPIYADGNSAR